MLAKDRFESSEEVINETETYFAAKDKLFYQKGVKILKNMIPNGDYFDE